MNYSFILILLSLTLLLFSCDKDNIFHENDTTSHKTANIEPNNNSPFPFCQSNPNPIGGGFGYDNIISLSDADIYINHNISALDFKNIVENALSGTIIYINPNLTIDLSNIYLQTGSYSIKVPEGITIASNRGEINSKGALIKTNDFEWNTNEYTENANPLFEIRGDNVRFTGLRFQGPSSEIETSENQRVKSCIRIQDNYKNLKVDNNEFYAWPFTAIKIGGFRESGATYNLNYVEYNYFHDCKQMGYGYAVHVDRGYALIHGNLFARNRHDICGSGKGKSSYEASCNTVLSGGIGHNFDMHAGAGNDPNPEAGQYINIHHNVFHDVGLHRHNPWNIQNIYIRGRTTYQCRIENNKFAHTDPNVAILQSNGHGGYGNMLVLNNIYGSKYLGWYVKKKWLRNDVNNFMNIPSSNDNLMLPPASGSSYDYAYEFGDYNGDGKTDIFKLENGKLYAFPLETSILSMGDWVFIKNIPTKMSDLKFLFYNNDNYTDIIRKENAVFTDINGSKIDFLSGPISPNSQWNTITQTTSNLKSYKFGDFNGNGFGDIFIAKNSKWKVLYDSNPNWQIINSSNYLSDQLRLGHFNADNKSDVFVADGLNFKVSYGGTSPWVSIFTSNLQTSDLIIVDFDGDNFSDIYNIHQNKVLRHGSSTWEVGNIINFPIHTFTYGDF